MSQTLTQTPPTEPSWLSRVKRIDEEKGKEEEEGKVLDLGEPADAPSPEEEEEERPMTGESDRTLEEGREKARPKRERHGEEKEKETDREAIEEGREDKGLSEQPRVWKEGDKVNRFSSPLNNRTTVADLDGF
jgi:hypothetical protein